MAKSKIIKELANNEVSLEVGLRRLMIISSDIKNIELKKWASKELSGYGEEDELPVYRLIDSGHINYSGIKGRLQMTNQTLPVAAFPSEYREILLKPLDVRDSIAKIESIVSQKETVTTDITILGEALYKAQGIQAYSIRQVYDSMQFKGILDKLATSLLEIYIELDTELGNLDDLDVSVGDVNLDKLNEATQRIINIDASGDGASINIIGGDATNATQSVTVEAPKNEILQLVHTMLSLLEELEDSDIKCDVKGYLTDIETEVSLPIPDETRISRFVRGIKNTLEPVKNFNAVVTLYGHLDKLIPLIAAFFNQQ